MSLIKTEQIVRTMTATTHRKVMKKINKQVMLSHRDKRLQRHFEHNADTAPGGGYGYVKRGERYSAYKRKRFGTDLPNVRTGRMRRHVRNNSFATSTQHKGRLIAKNYFKMPQRQRDELEAVTRAETGDMAAEQAGRYAAEAAKPANQPKRKIRS